MNAKKVSLQVMLWSLGLAAVGGVLAVLIPGHDAIWRVISTGFLTGGATALMLPLSWLMDKPKNRSAGLLGMGSIIVQYLLILPLIWGLLRGWDSEQRLVLSVIFLFLTTPVAMGGLRLFYIPMAALAGRVGVMACAVFYLLILLAIWMPEQRWNSQADDLWLTAFSIGGFGVLSALCLINAGLSARRYWPWAGILAAMVACVLALIHIWADIKGGAGLFTAITCLAVMIAHANLAILVPLKDGQRWVRLGTLAAVFITGIVVTVYVIYDEQNHTLYGLERLAAASGIVAGCGSMALLVLARMNRQVEHEPESFTATEIMLVCPRCNKKQTLAIGEAACSDCQLRIFVRIEEPRCPACGYLLYKLASDRCPECGLAIEPSVKSVPTEVQVPEGG